MGRTLDWMVEVRFSESEESSAEFTHKAATWDEQLSDPGGRWRAGETFEETTARKLQGTQD